MFGEMPLTKHDLEQIKEAFGITDNSSLKESLGLNVLHESITSLDNKLTTLDTKFSEKLSAVETSNNNLTVMIQADRVKNEQCFNELKEADEALDARVIEKDEQIKSLTERLNKLERRSSHNEQHGRRWNIEVNGIPNTVEDADLESVVIDILFNIGVECERSDLEAVHRLPSKTDNKPTIFRFANRKFVDQCWENKYKLNTLNLSAIPGLERDRKIYFNPSLCTYYKELSYNCRKLKKEGLISKVKIDDNGNISVVLLNGSTFKVKHHTDLQTKFPDFKEFSFDQ